MVERRKNVALVQSKVDYSSKRVIKIPNSDSRLTQVLLAGRFWPEI